MALYKDGNPVSGLNSIPRLTLAQYNALNVKPDIWIRTDAPESYKKLSADQVSYDSNNTVKDKLDEKNGFSLYGTFTKSSSVETGTYPTDKSFIVSIFGSGVCTTVFVDTRYHLNKYIYLDSTHKAYFNTSGAFGMGDLEDGTVVVIIQMD